MVFQVNRECVKAFLEPKCLNPRKTMISSLIRPRYKLNKVLSDPYCMCVCFVVLMFLHATIKGMTQVALLTVLYSRGK